MQGRVRKFSPDKRFGQIRPDGEKIDLFFHRADVIAGSELCFSRGAYVSFVVTVDPKHPGSRRAIQVMLIESPEEKVNRERVEAIKEKGRQIRQAMKIESDKQARIAREDERRGRLSDPKDQKPAYVADRDLEDFFLSTVDEDLN